MEAILGNTTGWEPFVCERWRTDRVREVSGLRTYPYIPIGGQPELIPPSFLSAQYVDTFALGVPDAPARLNGGNQCQFLADVRVGDELERMSTVVDVESKSGRTGRLEIYGIETTYRRAGAGPEVAKLRYTAIRRYPAEGAASAANGAASGTSGTAPSGPDLPAGAVTVFTATVSPRDVVRYAVATEDLYEAHYDEPFARASGLPGTIVHGLLKLAWLARGAIEVAGAGSVVREISASYRGMDLVKDSFSVLVARETDTRLRLYLRSSSGVITTTGTAVIKSTEE